MVKHRKYEIPIDIFSSDSSDHHSEADLAPKYDVAGRIDQLARNDADGNVRGVQDHLSGSSNEEPDADEIPKPNIRNNAREDSTTKGDMCDSDEEIDYTDPETESSLESLLSRLVSLTGVMPVNDIITLSAVLWNIIAIDDNGDNFPKTLLSVSLLFLRVQASPHKIIPGRR